MTPEKTTEKLVSDNLSVASPADGLECGDCGACCTLLPIVELNKPARWACDHLTRRGCGHYDRRPDSCRAFNCLWLRGALGIDGELRPDRLGVMFDWFRILGTGRERCQAFELWNGAFDDPRVALVLEKLASMYEVDLSYRDGRWRTIGTIATTATD